jgi:hypothetical protein
MALVTLTLAPGSGAPGTSVNLALAIASTGGAQPTGVEFTISNDANVTLTGVAIGAAATAASKVLDRVGNLCIIRGLNVTAIADGTLATLTFLIALSPSTTPITITITNVIVSDANADAIPSAVVASSLTITVPTLACPVSGGTATVGLAYLNNMVGSGGTPPYTYAVTGGSLPTGLSMNSAGLISGTPTAGGPFSWTTTVTDSIGATGSQFCGIVVASPLPPPPVCILVPADPYSSPLLLLNEPVEQVGT